MSDNGDKNTRALAPSLPIAVQTRAAAVSMEQTDAMLPTIQALWPQDLKNNAPLARIIAKVAIAYGLDPLAGELILYQGRPYVTIDGRLRKAQEHPQYAGLECRPATDEERAAFRCAETDHLWRSEVYRRDWQKPVIGWGRVTANDHNALARGQHAQAIAEKRAKARALRDAFSIPLPSAEDADSYDPAPQRYIDAETGEITDTRTGGMLAMQGHLAAIHILGKHLGVTEAERHEHLRQMFNKSATNELTEGEAAAYLEWLGNMQAEREAKNPLVVEGKARDAAITQVPHETGRQFEAVPGWPPAHDYGQDFEEQPEDEAPVADAVMEPEAESPGAAMPETVIAVLKRAHSALITGKPFPFQDDPKRKGVQAKGATDRLKLFGFTLDEVGALYVLAHFTETGELLDSQEAYRQVDARYFTGLQTCEDAIIEGLHEAARWFLARQALANEP